MSLFYFSDDIVDDSVSYGTLQDPTPKRPRKSSRRNFISHLNRERHNFKWHLSVTSLFDHFQSLCFSGIAEQE